MWKGSVHKLWETERVQWLQLSYNYCSVPDIRPLFCNLSASQKRRGAYMRDLTFYLANMPPLPVPCLNVDTGTLNYILLQKLARHQSAFTSLLQKLNGQYWLTEVGHSVDGGVFQALLEFVLSMCYSIWHHSRSWTRLQSSANSSTVLWTLALFWRCHSITETLTLTV